MTPRSAKFFTLRVTSVRSCSMAVAAIRPSMFGSGVPLSRARAERPPHRSAIALVTWSTRSSNHRSRSLSSHPSNSVRRLPRARRSIPLRISPKLKTLAQSRSGSVGPQPISDVRIGFPSPFKLREDIRIQKEPAHKSTGRPKSRCLSKSSSEPANGDSNRKSARFLRGLRGGTGAILDFSRKA